MCCQHTGFQKDSSNRSTTRLQQGGGATGGAWLGVMEGRGFGKALEGYLFHVATQFWVWGLVDSVPVHRNFDLLVELKDDESIVDVSVTHTE